MNSEIQKIAITGVSGDVGMGAIAGLKNSKQPFWILGLDYSDDCAGYHLCDAFHKVKPIKDPDYLHQLETLLSEYKIDLLLCGVDSEVALLSESKQSLETKTGCKIVVADIEYISIFSDKFETFKWLEKYNLNPPATFECSYNYILDFNKINYPLIAKPKKGNAANGLYTINSENELASFLMQKHDNYILQEYIEGDEYTCGLLFDSFGFLKDYITTKRILINGRTMIAEVCQLNVIDCLINDFANNTKLIGAINIQLRIDKDGLPRIFEVNPRLSGSTAMRVAVGFNDPLRIAEHWLYAKPITKAEVASSKIYRLYTELIIIK